MQKKIENVQALRGFSTLLVVIYHVAETEKRFAYSDLIFPGVVKLCAAGVDIFFIISGFVIVTVAQGRFQSVTSVLKFLYNRATRVYSLYWFYTGVVMVFFLLPPEMFSRSHQDVDVLRSFFLLPQANLPLLVVAWTIVHEIYFYIVFAAMMTFAEKRLLRLLFCWALCVLVGGVVSRYVPCMAGSEWMKIIVHPVTMEFIAGCLIARMVYGGIRAHGGLLFVIGVALLFVNHIVMQPDMAMDRWDHLFFYGLPSILVVYGAVVMEINSSILLPRIFRILGDASYSIYLTHYIVLPVLGRLWYMVMERCCLDNEGYLDNILAVVTMIAASVVFGIVSFRFIESPMMMGARGLRGRIFTGG